MATEDSVRGAKDYADPPPAPLWDRSELKLWSFYRAVVAEFVATLLFLYVTMATAVGNARNGANCGGVGPLGVAWSFGGMIFVLVYCTAGISGGHINPAVTWGLFLARKVSLPRAVLYAAAQCAGAVCGAALAKALQEGYYVAGGGGANVVAHGYTKGKALLAEAVGTFVLVYTVFSATDPKHTGAAADRVRGVRGAPGDHPDNRHEHKPRQELWAGCGLRPQTILGRPLDLLGGTVGGGRRGRRLPPARSASGVRQSLGILPHPTRRAVDVKRYSV